MTRGQARFLTQLKEYIETNDMFKNKDSFEFLSYENLPSEVQSHSSKMGSRWVLNLESFLEHLNEILKDREYTTKDKESLRVLREVCIRQDYPFQEFKFDPRKKINE